MKTLLISLMLMFAFGLIAFGNFGNAQDAMGDPEMMQKIMERGQELAKPGPQHEMLSRFIGTWNSTMVVKAMPGIPNDSGTATFKWALDGRFIQGDISGNMMGMPMTGILFLGFDNFKNKFNTVWLSSMNTNMLMGEGFADQTGNAISYWGNMDEWMTDEHDKTVMWRYTFESKDKIVFDMHDLSIVPGETNVFSIIYTRKK